MRREEEASLAPSYSIVFLGTGETSAEQSLISKKKKNHFWGRSHLCLALPSFFSTVLREGKESYRSGILSNVTIFLIDSSTIRKWRNQPFDVIVFISASLLLFIETQKRKKGTRLFNTSFKKKKKSTTNFPKCLRTIKRRRHFWSIN